MQASVPPTRAFAAVLAAACLFACGSGSTPSSCGAGDGIGAFTVGGVQYGSACVKASSDGAEETISIGDQRSSFDMTLVLPSPLAPGTYALTQDEAAGAPSFASVESTLDMWMTVNGSWSTGGANTGAVVITSFDATTGELAGTFSFDAGAVGDPNPVGTLHVTAGTFTAISNAPRN